MALAMVWMIPLALDAAVANHLVEVAKFACLVFAGMVACLSWCGAPIVAQGFVVGNVVWMGCVIGMLYQDTPQRLCNSYLEGDQQRAGQLVVINALILGCIWFYCRLRR
ncbi:MAG: hypothetical protein WBK51_00925 [Polaromonas sp.]